MRSSKSILSIAVALALSVMPGLASPSKGASATKSSASDTNGKNSHPAMKKFEGKVVSMTADTLVVRAGNGKKDEVFKIDPSTVTAAGISPGNQVTVNYRKDNSRYVATDIELSGTN